MIEYIGDDEMVIHFACLHQPICNKLYFVIEAGLQGSDPKSDTGYPAIVS